MRALLSTIIIVAVSLSCKKYKDQTMPDVGGQLTRKYCNDPIANNYNDSFPGVPDNSTCIYATDRFVGVWDVVDSIFRADKNFQSKESKTITFIATSDSLRKNMNMTGWFVGNTNSPIKMTANKYGIVTIINNIPNTDSGQVVYGNDTLSGKLILIENKDSAMTINFFEKKVNGLHLIHKAVGIKRK